MCKYRRTGSCTIPMGMRFLTAYSQRRRSARPDGGRRIQGRRREERDVIAQGAVSARGSNTKKRCRILSSSPDHMHRRRGKKLRGGETAPSSDPRTFRRGDRAASRQACASSAGYRTMGGRNSTCVCGCRGLRRCRENVSDGTQRALPAEELGRPERFARSGMGGAGGEEGCGAPSPPALIGSTVQ